MHICHNRLEGFGPKSTISSPLPTSCFTDTIIVPLPIYLALLSLLPLTLLSLRSRGQTFDSSARHLQTKFSRNWLFNLTSTIYYLLIAATALMEVLELVRLSMIHFNVTMLPFVFVGLGLGAFLHWSNGFQGRVRGWQAINAVLWIGGAIVMTVKTIGLAREGIHARRGSKYPMEDQITDVAVMAGLYGVIAVLEVGLGVWRASRTMSKREERKGSTSPVMGNHWEMKQRN